MFLTQLLNDGQQATSNEAVRSPANGQRPRVPIPSEGPTPPRPESAAALAELLHSPDDYARRSAAILLVHQEPAVAVPALIGALRDSDENTRANARESLRVLARGRDLGDDAGAWQRWWADRSR